MLDQYRLCLLPFIQGFDGNNLSFNILILPQIGPQWNGNPLQLLPLGFPNAASTGPAFATSDLQFEARIISGLGQFPSSTLSDDTIALGIPGTAPDAPALFTELQNHFNIKNSPVAGDFAEAPKKSLFIKKYLTKNYRAAFNFSAPRVPEAVIDDSYHCAVKEDKKRNPNFQVTPDEVTWGKVYAYCLRHPLLARRMGLIRDVSIPVDTSLLTDGGFLYVSLAEGSDYMVNPGTDDHFNFIRHYATRIPALESGTARTLFSPVLFPVLYNVAGPTGNYDQVFIEASDYDDGFAKIVHANQPLSQNLLAEEEDGFSPLTDIGIRLGWDDEQVLIWQNRQLKEMDNQPGQRLDAPMGVFSYRIDMRELGDTDWSSLVEVASKSALQLGPVNLGTYTGELGVEVHPMQLDGDQQNGQYWLPSYFTNWNGQSLVLPDEIAADLFHTNQATTDATNLGRMYNPSGLENVSLRYGHNYQFRVRLMDPTGGGPTAAADPFHEAPAPIADIHFKRFVKPEPLRIGNMPRFPDVEVDTYFSDDNIILRRPLLGYPSVVYTDKYADPIPLLQAASDAAIGVDSFGIADPDVIQVQVEVEVRSLKMDNLLSISGDEPYIHLYTTYRDLPATFEDSLEIPLVFQDAPILNFGDPADLGDLNTTEADLLNLSEIILPTGREIRLTLRGVGQEDPNYYGATDTHIGKPIQIKLRRQSTDETDLLAQLSPSRSIRGIYMQPEPEQANNGRISSLLLRRDANTQPSLIQRLADQLDVENKGLTLVGEKGQRVVFGCSRRLRHTLAPDHSSLTFASKDELVNQWIVAITLQLDRDWTWDGMEQVSFEIFREKQFGEGPIGDNNGRPIGDLELHQVAPINALQKPDRSKTTLIFLDAVEPKSSAPGAFPDIINLDYRIESRFKQTELPENQDEPVEYSLMLPVTTVPTQVPKIASAGVALSPYKRNEAYSASEAREHYLWLEFEEPVLGPNDNFFIRILGYAPDPLLSDNRLETFVPPEEPALNIDPELIRVITPGQSDDQAGLGAMQPLEKAVDSDRHFLIPLPPGLHPESNELFGFFTYEIRTGHTQVWSTAQGRFGRALRTTGVQHPAPTLFCTCHRDEKEILVEAPYAMAVLNGKNITAHPPRTEIWALLYAQVKQVDGKDFRNILLDEQKLELIPRRNTRQETTIGTFVVLKGNEDAPTRAALHWNNAHVNQMLRSLGLPLDADLSVVCVEMMPRIEAPPIPGSTTTTRASGANQSNLVESVRTLRGNSSSGLTEETTTTVQTSLRPLSNQLGHYRILRTSPLTPVPEVCCTEC